MLPLAPVAGMSVGSAELTSFCGSTKTSPPSRSVIGVFSCSDTPMPIPGIGFADTTTD